MDQAVSIERRLAAMKKLHDAGTRTSCFMSPIFPGIADAEAIIDRVYQGEAPELYPLYVEIYIQGSRTYWKALDEQVRAYAMQNGLAYVRDDNTIHKPSVVLHSCSSPSHPQNTLAPELPSPIRVFHACKFVKHPERTFPLRYPGNSDTPRFGGTLANMRI